MAYAIRRPLRSPVRNVLHRVYLGRGHFYQAIKLFPRYFQAILV